jgi:hypothetical protein
MSNRGRWILVIAIGVIVFLVGFAVQPGGATSGYDAGRQFGYAVGQGLIAALVTYLILRVLARRRPGA